METSPSVSEALELLLMLRDSQVGLMQWWASITFALVAVTYLGRKHLNLPITVVLLVLYASFTYVVIFFFVTLGAQQGQLTRYLESVADQELWTSILIDSLSSLQLPASVYLTMVVMFGMAFLAGAGYVVYTYASGTERYRHSRQAVAS